MVTGAPATGKTTLAAQVAVRLRLPVFAHDDVRAGLAFTDAVLDVDAAQALGPRTWAAYYELIRSLALVGVSCITDAHFHRGRSEAELEPLLGAARMLLVHCVAERPVVVERVRRRRKDPDRVGWLAIGDSGVLERMESGVFEWEVHEQPLDLPIPKLVLDTTRGADVGLVEQFVAAP